MQKPGAGLGQRHKVPGRADQAQPARRWGTPLRSLGYRYCFWRNADALADARDRATATLEEIGLASRRDVPAGVLTYAEQRMAADVRRASRLLTDADAAAFNQQRLEALNIIAQSAARETRAMDSLLSLGDTPRSRAAVPREPDAGDRAGS